MSHFTRIRTQLRDIDMVKRALEDLGYTVMPTGMVRGYRDQQVQADLVVRMDGNYDIGFRLEGKAVNMVADFWGLRINADELLKKITQRYAYLTVVDQATEQGWQKVTEEAQEDGSIRLVMQRWD